jgi:hypothetical protein
VEGRGERTKREVKEEKKGKRDKQIEDFGERVVWKGTEDWFLAARAKNKIQIYIYIYKRAEREGERECVRTKKVG